MFMFISKDRKILIWALTWLSDQFWKMRMCQSTTSIQTLQFQIRTISIDTKLETFHEILRRQMKHLYTRKRKARKYLQGLNLGIQIVELENIQLNDLILRPIDGYLKNPMVTRLF